MEAFPRGEPKPNTPPIASDGELNVTNYALGLQGGKLTATDQEGNTLAFHLVEPLPTKGIVTLDSLTGEYTFKLNNLIESGVDYISFHVTDGRSLSNTAKITVNIKRYEVSLGSWHTCALHDGGVRCWGHNNFGQAGSPVLTNPRNVSAGDIRNCALHSSGITCWGANQSYPYVDPLLGKMISVGANHACALASSVVSCAGVNGYINLNKPTLTRPTFVSTGDHFACAVDESAVKCWGKEQYAYGQTTPPLITDAQMVSASHNYACALTDSGLICWGLAPGGAPSLNNAKHISAGYKHMCALDDDGVKCWGNNSYGQINVPALTRPRFVAAGRYHTCAIHDLGLKCWGHNQYGQTNVPALSFSGLEN